MAKYNKSPSQEQLEHRLKLGDTIKQISVHYGVSAGLIRNKIRTIGLKLPEEKSDLIGSSALTKDRLIELRKKYSIRTIARQYGICDRTVMKKVNEYGLPLTKRKKSRKDTTKGVFNFGHEYFIEDEKISK